MKCSNHPNANIKQYYDAKSLQERIDLCKQEEQEEQSKCIEEYQTKFNKGTIVVSDYPKTGGRKPRRRTNKKRRAKRKSLHRRR